MSKLFNSQVYFHIMNSLSELTGGSCLRNNVSLAIKLLSFSRDAWVRVRGSTLDHEVRSLFQLRLTRAFIPDSRFVNWVPEQLNIKVVTRACNLLMVAASSCV